jgi:hypothetical protein
VTTARRHDPRLSPPGSLSALVELICESENFGDEEEVRSCCRDLSLDWSKVTGSSASKQWESLIVQADERDPPMVGELVSNLVRRAAGDRIEPRLKAWLARGHGALEVNEAAHRLRDYLNTVRSAEDPRDVEPTLSGLASTLVDLARTMDNPAVANAAFGGLRDSRRAISRAQAAIRTASASVDRLLHGVRLADEALGRVGANSRAEEYFDSADAIAARLLDVRSRVDEHISRLVQTLDAAMPLAPDSDST